MYMCIYTCVCVCVCVNVWMCVCVYVYVYVYVCVCDLCMYVCVCVQEGTKRVTLIAGGFARPWLPSPWLAVYLHTPDIFLGFCSVVTLCR